jgi:hypothetical protein
MWLGDVAHSNFIASPDMHICDMVFSFIVMVIRINPENGFLDSGISKQANAKDNQTPRARLVALFSVLYAMASDLTKCTHLKM